MVSGFQAQGVWAVDPYVYVVFWARIIMVEALAPFCKAVSLSLRPFNTQEVVAFMALKH